MNRIRFYSCVPIRICDFPLYLNSSFSGLKSFIDWKVRMVGKNIVNCLYLINIFLNKFKGQDFFCFPSSVPHGTVEVSYLVAWRKVPHLVQNCGRGEENTTYMPGHVPSTSHTLSPLSFINYKVKALFYSHWVLMMVRHNKLPPQKWKAEFFITYSSVSSKKAAVQDHTWGCTWRKGYCKLELEETIYEWQVRWS